MDRDGAGHGLDSGDPVERATAAASIGLRGATRRGSVSRLVAMAHDDPDPRAAAAALGALVRRAGPTTAARAWRRATAHPSARVRRRAAELAPRLAPPPPAGRLLALLADRDASVAEAAAWALGEVASGTAAAPVVTALAVAATGHPEPLVRESAVASLGAIGDPDGLDAILAACGDRPAVRRRAVLALAPFDDPRVEAAIAAASDDPDWQVRQAAEDLTA